MKAVAYNLCVNVLFKAGTYRTWLSVMKWRHCIIYVGKAGSAALNRGKRGFIVAVSMTYGNNAVRRYGFYKLNTSRELWRQGYHFYVFKA